MKNNFILLIAVAGFLSCNNSESKASTSEDLFSTFTIHGKELSIPSEEISTSYMVALKKTVFKVLTGKYGKIKVKVFGGDATNDPKVKDHILVGKFRVKHDFSDVKF